MLEGELNDHLGYNKHEKAPNQNSRNDYGQKKVLTSLGESQIDVPRDWDATFNPMLVPKQGNMIDGIVFKVRENSKLINKTIYIAVGLRRDGKKEVLELWLSKNESSAYWMSVLTDMKARGLQDLLITATDNLNDFTETISNVFPQVTTPICVVHQIRNVCRHVVWKDKKEFTQDMKDL